METEAQSEAMKNAEPEKEHLWLFQLIGEWTAEGGESGMSGCESVKAVGGIWVVAEGRGPQACGAVMETRVTLGFDPQKQKFVGTWVDSLMPRMWLYEGELDAAANALSLYCEGPSLKDDNKTALYRDTITLVTDDQKTLTASIQNENGEWETFMTTNYRRIK